MSATIHVQYEPGDTIITITSERRQFFLFGPVLKHVQRYRGSGTVWHDADSGRRVSTFREAYLCDIWQKAQWKYEDAKRAKEASRREKMKRWSV